MSATATPRCGFLPAARWLTKQVPRMPHSARAAYLTIGQYANAGRADPTLRELADVTGLHPDSVDTALKWLREAGLLAVVHATGRANRYVLLRGAWSEVADQPAVSSAEQSGTPEELGGMAPGSTRGSGSPLSPPSGSPPMKDQEDQEQKAAAAAAPLSDRPMRNARAGRSSPAFAAEPAPAVEPSTSEPAPVHAAVERLGGDEPAIIVPRARDESRTRRQSHRRADQRPALTRSVQWASGIGLTADLQRELERRHGREALLDVLAVCREARWRAHAEIVACAARRLAAKGEVRSPAGLFRALLAAECERTEVLRTLAAEASEAGQREGIEQPGHQPVVVSASRVEREHRERLREFDYAIRSARTPEQRALFEARREAFLDEDIRGACAAA